MESLPKDPVAKPSEILAHLAAGEVSSSGTSSHVLAENLPQSLSVSPDPGTPSGTAFNVESFTDMLDSAASRYTDGGALGLPAQPSEALIQELVAERCQVIRHELETKYASIAADSKLLQRKMDTAVAKLNHELEVNKKTWKEEAVRIWEAMDMRTPEVSMDPEEKQNNMLSSLPSHVEKTFSSLTARMDLVEGRITDIGVSGISTESSAAFVTELVAEQCLIIRQDLESTYHSTAEKCLQVRQELESTYQDITTVAKLLQIKLNDAVAKLDHELETNKKTWKNWKEEAIRIWQAIDTHTHEVFVGGGSESRGTSVLPQDLETLDGTDGPELVNDSTLDLTRVTVGSASSVVQRVQLETPDFSPGIDDIGASLMSLARQLPQGRPSPIENTEPGSLTATTVTIVQPANGDPPSMGSSHRTPSQQYRSIPLQGESASRQNSPQTQFRLTQQQGSVSIVTASQMTPGQQFRSIPQQGVESPSRQTSQTQFRFAQQQGSVSVVTASQMTPGQQFRSIPQQGVESPSRQTSPQFRFTQQQGTTVSVVAGGQMTPGQQFRAIQQQGVESPSRQASPHAQFRFTQPQGSVGAVVGSPTTPGQQFRVMQQQGAASVRTRSISPPQQTISVLKVTDGARHGSPQRPSDLPPVLTTLPRSVAAVTTVPGVRMKSSPVRKSAPDVPLDPPMDDSGWMSWRRRTGPPIKRHHQRSMREGDE